MKFFQMPGGLYVCNPKLSEKEKQNSLNIIEQRYLSVEENTQYISNRQLKKVQDVKIIQNALAMPSYRDPKAIITMNMIKDSRSLMKI